MNCRSLKFEYLQIKLDCTTNNFFLFAGNYSFMLTFGLTCLFATSLTSVVAFLCYTISGYKQS